MLYIQLLLVAGVLSAHSVSSISYEDVISECSKTFGFDTNIEKIATEFKDPEFPQNKKCGVACILEKKDVIKADGSIDREMDKKLIEEAVKDEDMRKKYFKAIDECDVSAKENKCKTAFEFVKCKLMKAGMI